MYLEPIKIKRKFSFNLILPFLLIIVINISVLFAAIYVDKEQKRVRDFYEDYNNKVAFLDMLKNISVLNDNINMQMVLIQQNTQTNNIPSVDNKLQDRINSITKSEEKVVYLTFDDGPSRKVTPHVLEILKRNDVKATFFVLGSRINYYPDLVKQEYEEGHYIANHGYSHVYSDIYSSQEAFMNEVYQTEDLIREAIGNENYTSHLVRFPGGSPGGKYADIKSQIKQTLNDNGFGYVDWNALTRDSEGNFSKEELIENCKKTCEGKNSVILLMHDAGNKITTYEALEDIIIYFKDQGYEFRTFYDVVN